MATSTRSVLEQPFAAASAGLTAITLSQVILVSGFGSSCSQATFAKRPSQMVGSGRKIISASFAFAVIATGGEGTLGDTLSGFAAVSCTNPSCKACVQR